MSRPSHQQTVVARSRRRRARRGGPFLLRLLALALLALGLPLVAGLSVGAAPDVAPGLNGNEPHAAVANPLNPQNVIVSDVNRLRISNDFGATFPISVSATNTAAATAASSGYCGDDVLAFDAAGRLFWSYLICSFDNASPNPNRIDISIWVQQVNPTTGALIGGAADITPSTNALPNLHSDDKEWLVADANPSSPYANNLYMVWSRLDGGGSQIMFVRSTNQGATWSAPQAISAGGEGFVWPSHIAVGPNGDIYAGYHSDTCGAATASMFIIRDSSGGGNLSASPAVIPQKTSFQSAVTCNVQASPPATNQIANTHFWMQGAMQPYILADPTRPGNVYVIANDDPNNDFTSGDPGDVILARSTDYGNTWSISTISHAPAGTLQVFPQAAIDQNGRIVVTWWDTRRQLVNNGPDATAGTADDYFNLDTYATVSRDGGLTFTNDFRVNDAPFDPDLGAPCRFGCGAGGTRTLRIGEYNGLSAVNGVAYVAFTGNTAGGGQQIFFDVFSILGAFPDEFEPNDAIQAGVATDLGAPATYGTQGLTIHTDTDEDFFKVTALQTGKLTFQIGMNGRIADLDIQVRDKFNVAVATSSVAADTNNTETITIPVVAGQPYYLRVFAQPGQVPPLNVYSLSVTNTAAPVPLQMTLAPGSDTGWDPTDRVTNLPTPTILLRLDEAALAGLTLSATPDATLTNDAPGFKVEVLRNGSVVGYAAAVGGQPGIYSFTFPGGAGGSLSEGVNFLTARIVIVDPSDDPNVGGTAHVVARGGESDVFLVTLDSTPPAAPSVPDLLPTSDSGPSNTDNITGVNPPAFRGTGEANAIIRIRANGVLVGQATIGSDATDGVIGNGLGAWEVTIEPLADGTYAITAEVEDLAGNISAPSAAMAPPLVLDTPGSGTPQRPTIDLLNTSDSGRSDIDNVTRMRPVTVRVSAEEGSTTVIKDGNTVIDTFIMPAGGFTNRVLDLAEGPHPLSAESTDAAGNRSAQSAELLVTIDLTAPATPAAPDLQGSSDSGGVDDDNITTITTPTFQGSGEPNALVRVYANGVLVGQGVATAAGNYQVTVGPLADGVYSMTVVQEDLAGNVSGTSPALKVTIANQSLTLPNAMVTAAGGAVTIDLAAGTVAGYTGVASATGKVGIVGIPVVNLNLNGKALTVLGTAGDDSLRFTPSGPQAGRLTRGGVAQTLNLAAVGGTFTIDPLGGNDIVAVDGTANVDTIAVVMTTITTVKVNNFLMVSMPIANVERLQVNAGQGADTINVDVYDTVNAYLWVDADDPSAANRNADELVVTDKSGKAQIQNSPGGPVPGSGVVTVDYRRSTATLIKIEYINVEKFTKR